MTRVDADDIEVDDSLTHCYRGQPFTGESVEQTRSGAVVEVTPFVNGRRHGVQRSWYPTGEPKSEVTLDNGNAVGIGMVWHRNGMPARSSAYRDDGSAEVREWDEDGVEVPRG